MARLSVFCFGFTALALTVAPASQAQKADDTPRQTAPIPPPIAGGGVLAPAATPVLSEQDQLDLDTCRLVVADIREAKDSFLVRQFSQELLRISERLAQAQPGLVEIWIWRGAAALELGDSKVGWDAARNLKKLGIARSDNEDGRRILAMLNRRGWLTDQYADVEKAREREMSDVASAQQEAAAQRSETERAATLARAKNLYGWMEGRWEIDNWLGGPLELQTQWDRSGAIDIRLNKDGRFAVSGRATATAKWTSDDSPPANYDQQLRATVKTFDPATNSGKGEFVSTSTYQAGDERGRPAKGNWEGAEFTLALGRPRQASPRVTLECNGHWITLRPAR